MAVYGTAANPRERVRYWACFLSKAKSDNEGTVLPRLVRRRTI